MEEVTTKRSFEDFCLVNQQLSESDFRTKVIDEMNIMANIRVLSPEDFISDIDFCFGMSLHYAKREGNRIKFGCFIEQLVHISQNRTRYQSLQCV